jgi:hypothetical protein
MNKRTRRNQENPGNRQRRAKKSPKTIVKKVSKNSGTALFILLDSVDCAEKKPLFTILITLNSPDITINSKSTSTDRAKMDYIDPVNVSIPELW